MERHEVIVVGVGGMGSAAVFHLARRGIDVLGIEQFELGHSLGSSGSPSRGFRKAYFSHPHYVPLANSAQALWQALERDSGEELLRLNSALFIGAPEHPGVLGVEKSAREHRLPHERLDSRELRRRYPVLKPADEDVGILEVEAGVLFADRCNAAHVRLATAAGATIRSSEPITSLIADGDGITVRTEHETYRARRAIVTAGPWFGAVFTGPATNIPPLRAPLQVERQVELWFDPEPREAFGAEKLPMFHFGLRDAGRSYYGVPRFDAAGVKVCRHYGGKRVTAASLDRTASVEDETDVRQFLRQCVPEADGALLDAKVCMNTNTPDMHFVIGHHPANDKVIVAGGFSGHGYKFAPVVGEILADLATTGTTQHPIGLFAPGRFDR